MKVMVMTAVALCLVTGAPVGAATLMGTQVSGALYFAGYPANFFDPVNGLVPAGYLNAAGSTVTISATAVEFGFADSTASITADFTSSQLLVTDQPRSAARYNPIQLVFTNAAFTNLAVVSDTFPNDGLTGAVNGSVITLNWAGGNLTSGQPVQAVFNVNVPPSPRLGIALTATNTVVLSWPESAAGFNLQQNGNVTSTNWVAVTTPPVLINGSNQVIVSPTLGARFYRLKFP